MHEIQVMLVTFNKRPHRLQKHSWYFKCQNKIWVIQNSADSEIMCFRSEFGVQPDRGVLQKPFPGGSASARGCWWTPGLSRDKTAGCSCTQEPHDQTRHGRQIQCFEGKLHSCTNIWIVSERLVQSLLLLNRPLTVTFVRRRPIAVLHVQLYITVILISLMLVSMSLLFHTISLISSVC